MVFLRCLGVFLLCGTFFACTSSSTNKEFSSAGQHPLLPPEWPQPADAEHATLVVVNPYEKRCCGATPPYKVILRDLFGDLVYEKDDLKPIDDFFCIGLKPGRYSITLQSGGSSHNMKFALKAGEPRFVAADVHLLEPIEMFLYSMEKPDAMEYVRRAAHRISPVGQHSGRDPLLLQKLSCL